MSLALYRRYRPETFEEVIGQEHVTVPLQQALRNNRVNHAYLFSGPRGCGKTTSARILARSLNCEQGPTPTPCGVCGSCRNLARGGPGSIDVIEIDAASHGGVDDARELRDRAFLAPASSRFKVYIVDEAHMVSSAGFNALLKVVEEPPEHLKFIFATTEPEKVIGTIRSRTHHYPFRLVPPGVLRDYLAEVCEREGIAVEPGVLPMVVRAGSGSVRDSMSVLDQLLSGSGPDGVSYATATALLGYTDAALLDEVVGAIAARDGAAVFRCVDRVVEGGHDPRRFVADLLERLRDLVILSAVPDAASTGILDVPADQLERMQAQAAAFGPVELSRAADLVNTGLTEMRGATAPRLQLELICARLLLPGAYDDQSSLLTRVERLERRASYTAGAAPADAVVPAAAQDAASGAATPYAAESPGAEPPAASPPPAVGPRPPDTRTAVPEPPAAAPTATSLGTPPWKARRPDGPPHAAPPASSAAPPAAAAAPAHPAPGGAGPGGDAARLRQQWPLVLDEIARRKRFAWILLTQNAQVLGLHGDRLTVAFTSAGARDRFTSGGSEEILHAVIAHVLGVTWHIDTVVDPSCTPGGPPPATSAAPAAAPPNPAPAAGPPPRPGDASAARAPGPAASDPPGPPADGWAADDPGRGPDGGAPTASAAAPPTAPAATAELKPPPSAAVPPQSVTASAPVSSQTAPPPPPPPTPVTRAAPRSGGGTGARAADLPGAGDDLTPEGLLQRELGATVIEEFRTG